MTHVENNLSILSSIETLKTGKGQHDANGLDENTNKKALAISGTFSVTGLEDSQAIRTIDVVRHVDIQFEILMCIWAHQEIRSRLE